MTVKDPGRIPVGLFQGERLSDDAVRRLSVGASRIVAFADAADASAVRAQWSRVAPQIEVEVAPAAADVREAIIECAKRKVIWLAAPEPRNAPRFVAGALQGAAAATEFEIPSVAVHVLRDQSIAGPVAWLTQTGAMSGYGVLYAVAIAAMSGRSVTMIAPTELRAPRTPEAVEVAEGYIAESGVEVQRLSDPSPLQRVLGGSFGAVVHPVLDAPGGRSLLYPGELPAKSVAQGNPAAVVELLEEFPGDVVAVFDGVQLVYGSGAAARIAAGVALGITAVAGIGAVAAPAALAAEPAPASAPATHHAGQATDNKNGNLDAGAAWWKHDQGGSGSTDTPQAPELPNPDQPKPDEPKPDLPTPVVTPPVVTPTVQGPVVAPELPKPDLPTPVVTPPVVTPTVQGPVVAPELPKPDLPTPVRTPPVAVPTGQVPMLVPQLPKPDQPTPERTPPVVTPTQEGPMLVPELPKPDLLTPQSVPGGNAQTPVVGTQTPATTDGTSIVPGGTVTASTTRSGTSTPSTAETGTPGGTDRSGTTHAGTHQGGTTTQGATHRAEGSTEAQTTGGPSELAHTGAGETGLIAGLAAALMAAGAGLAALARRGADEEEGSGEATP